MPWLTAIPGALKLVPRWCWYALAAALVWHFALHWHAGRVKAHDTALIGVRDKQWQQQLDHAHADALAWKAKAGASAAKISTQVRETHDAQVRDNASDAGDLRLRGPGAAAAPRCGSGDRAGPAAGAGGPVATGERPAAAAGSLPSDQRLALVPWSWLVDSAQHADDSRAEVIAWRNWYVAQVQAWQAAKAASSSKGVEEKR